MADYLKANLYGGQAGRRPKPRPHAAIAPPFDPNDEYGNVHTELPPEQAIPGHFEDPTFLRADFGNLTLEGQTEPPIRKPDGSWNIDAIVAAGGVTIITGRWAGLRIPYLQGANTTPPTMFMSPMLPLYQRPVQDANLTEHAERGHDDLVVSHEPWNAAENGRSFSPAEMVAWGRYVHDEWGFRVVLWRGDRPPLDTPDDVTKAMLDAGLVSFLIWGKEVQTKMSSEEYEQSMDMIIDYTKGKVPIGAHFAADDNRGMGYPQSAADYIRDWSRHDGIWHLCQQLCATAPRNNPAIQGLCPAGLQGAAMYYGRKRVNLGAAAGEGGLGPGATRSRVIAFETMAIEALYGRCTEEYGALRDWELLCGTRTDSRVLPVHGFGNGARYPNGDPI